MAGTYTKAIIVKNQNHIKRFYKGKGGMTAFVDEVEHYSKSWRCSPYSVIAQLVNAPNFLWRTDDIYRYLHSLGLKDDKKIEKYKFTFYCMGGYETYHGELGLYAALLARDGAKLYDDWVKKHPKRK